MKRQESLRRLLLTLLLAGVVGVSVGGCLLPVPVPVGGGGGHHHHHGRW
jgi:hypothetical protein